MAEAGDRWAAITPDDHRGIVYIVAFLACTYSTLTFLTRCFIKWHVFGLDDAAMAIAQIVSFIQFALLLVSLSAGLGMTFDRLSADQYSKMVSFQFGNQIAVYISLGFSKLATVLLTQRLFTRDMKKAWTICHIVTVSVVVWTVVAGFLASAGCSPESMAPITPSQSCPSIVARYEIIVVTDAITDIVLITIPAYLCWQLQMSVLIKLQVLAVFSFRVPIIVFAGFFLKNWIRSLSSNNPGVERSFAIAFQQSELCMSLIAGTIPCLKSFIRSFDTGSGVKAGFGSSDGYGSSSHSSRNAQNHSGSYKLSPLNRNKPGTPLDPHRILENDEEDECGLIRTRSRPSKGIRSKHPLRRETNVTTAFKRQQEEPDRDSQGSGQELFIRKELEWEVGSDIRRVSDTPGMLRLPR